MATSEKTRKEGGVAYVADRLATEHATTFKSLRETIATELGELVLVPSVKDIWVRDFLPVQVDVNRFVQFRYEPSYLKNSPELRTGPMAPPGVKPEEIKQTSINFDGGNVVAGSTRAILTERAFRENPSISPATLRSRLEDLLELRVDWIPPEPGDPYGHADGVLHLWDDDTAIVNDYRKIDPAYEMRLTQRLKEIGVAFERLPYAPSKGALGNYVNFLRVGDLIIVPGYQTELDDVAQGTLKRLLPSARIVQCPAKSIALCGGSIRCVTWVRRLPSSEIPDPH